MTARKQRVLSAVPPVDIADNIGENKLPACGDAIVPALLPRLRQLLDASAEHGPVCAGPQALHQIHEARIVADQDARLVFLDTTDDAQRGGGRRGLGKAVESFDRLRAPRIIIDATAGAGLARDVGGLLNVVLGAG